MLLDALLAQEEEGDSELSELVTLLPLVFLFAEGAANEGVGMYDIALGGVTVAHDDGRRSAEDAPPASLL